MYKILNIIQNLYKISMLEITYKNDRFIIVILYLRNVLVLDYLKSRITQCLKFRNIILVFFRERETDSLGMSICMRI